MTKRERGDKVLEKMASVQANFGTKSKLDVGTDRQRKAKLCELWRKLQKIDPERAEIIKPQNPYVK